MSRALNYSKWDALSDSEGEEPEPARPLEVGASLRVQGNDAWEKGEVRKAVDCYEAAVAALDAVQSAGAAAIRTPCLLNAVSGLLKLGEFARAEKHCDSVLADASEEERRRAFFFRGFARHKLGRLEDAASDLEAAVEQGADGEAKQLLRTVREELKARDSAPTAPSVHPRLDPVLSTFANDSSKACAAVTMLAREQRAAGDSEGAAATLAGAVVAAEAASWPKAAVSYLLRALAAHYDLNNDKTKALDAYRRAAALWAACDAPGDVYELDAEGEMHLTAASAGAEACRSLASLGRALVRDKQFAEALEPLRNALELVPSAGLSPNAAAVADELRLDCLDAVTEAAAREGFFDDALKSGQEAVTLASRLERWRTAADMLLTLAHIELELAPEPTAGKRAKARLEAAVLALEKCEPSLRTAEGHMAAAAAFQGLLPRSDASVTSEAVAKRYVCAAEAFCECRKRQAAQRDDEDKAAETKEEATAAANANESTLVAKEEEAWLNYAAALADGDDDERLHAYRRAKSLQDAVPEQTRTQAWLTRRAETLHGLALSAARIGDFFTAEQGLMEAVATLESGGAKANHARIRELLQCLAVARRRRGDMPGAQQALDAAKKLATEVGAAEEGREQAEALNRALREWRI